MIPLDVQKNFMIHILNKSMCVVSGSCRVAQADGSSQRWEQTGSRLLYGREYLFTNF